MNYLKLDTNICRMCLEHNSNLNWNDELFESSGVSYRDCYYKYTQMEEIDTDLYPTNLCERCADRVRNAHDLFEKALKSFIILQNTTNAKDYEALNIELNENNCIENCKNGRIDMDIDEVICYSPVQDDNQAEVQYVAKSQDTNFYSLGSPCGSSTEKQALGSFDIKLLMSKVDKEQIKKRRYLDALNMALELKLQLQISDRKLLKSLAYKNGTKSFKPFPLNLLQNQQSKTCENSQSKAIQRTSTADVLKHKNQSVIKDIPRRRTSVKDKLKPKNTHSNRTSPIKISLENFDAAQSLEKDQQTSKTVNMPLSNSILDDSDSNSFGLSNPTISKKSPLESSLPEENHFEHDDKEMKSYKPSEIALLKKIYGDDFDIKSKKLKSKPTKCLKPNPKICQYCSLVVLGKNKLLSHEATHLRKERNEICPKCGIKFFTKDTLKEHIKTHDENRQKEHKCGYCEKAFYNVGARNVHQRIHLGLMVKCPICPKEYCRQVDVDRHLPTHSVAKLSGSKKIKYKVHCQYCNKYILNGRWKAHKAAHLKEPQVKCKICDREFYARASCIKHIRKKHGETDECQQYIHYFNKIRMSHLLIKQQEVMEIVAE